MSVPTHGRVPHRQETLMRRLLSHRSLTIAVAIAVLISASAFGAEAAVQRTASSGTRPDVGGSAKTRRGKQRLARSHSRPHKHRRHQAQRHRRNHHRHKTKARKAPVAAPTPGAIVPTPSLTSPIGPVLSVIPFLPPITPPNPEKGAHP